MSTRKRETLRIGAVTVLAAGLLSASIYSQATQSVPVPLFRDPVHDGAADPTLIWNRGTREWWMFYTSRRADQATADPDDVRWVHGTHLGIAVSTDRGTHWTYRGETTIPYGDSTYTFWAPDIVFDHGTYHMFVTVVPGTFRNWNAPREIIHLTSKDLNQWSFVSKINAGSDRVIDPSLFRLTANHWRVWFKDERDSSHIHSLDSEDLVHWTGNAVAVAGREGEAPKVFQWKHKYWLITDTSDALAVYESSDLTHWHAQDKTLLKDVGMRQTDRNHGHHCDVIVHGRRAYIFYFTHQSGLDAMPGVLRYDAHTVLQVGELKMKHGTLSVDRNASIHVDLGIPHDK